jgi:hypothetical protein
MTWQRKQGTRRDRPGGGDSSNDSNGQTISTPSCWVDAAQRGLTSPIRPHIRTAGIPSGLQARARVDVRRWVCPGLITHHIKSRSLEAGFVIILVNTSWSAAPPKVRGDSRTLSSAADQEHRDPATLVVPRRPEPGIRGDAHSPLVFSGCELFLGWSPIQPLPT